MKDVWPRNIVPYDEKKLRALSSVGNLALYEGTADHPLREEGLDHDARARVEELVQAGLLVLRDGAYHRVHRHMRDPGGKVPGRLEYKRAIVQLASSLLEGTARALDARGPDETSAMAVVRLPADPETLAHVFAIVAEAEDQLRALAEDAPPRDPDAPELRVTLFIGSSP